MGKEKKKENGKNSMNEYLREITNFSLTFY